MEFLTPTIPSYHIDDAQNMMCCFSKEEQCPCTDDETPFTSDEEDSSSTSDFSEFSDASETSQSDDGSQRSKVCNTESYGMIEYPNETHVSDSSTGYESDSASSGWDEDMDELVGWMNETIIQPTVAPLSLPTVPSTYQEVMTSEDQAFNEYAEFLARPICSLDESLHSHEESPHLLREEEVYDHQESTMMKRHFNLTFDLGSASLSKKERMDSSDSTRETEDETLSVESEEYRETAHPVSFQTVAPEPPSEGPSSATPIASETVPETQMPAPFSAPREQELDSVVEDQTKLDVAVGELEEQGTPSSQKAEVSVCDPAKAFPEEPIDFEDIDDPDLKRACEKLLKMLNHDPWDEFKNYHDEDVCAFVHKHPDTCRVKYDFGHFPNKIFPFSMLCTLGVSRDSLKGVLDAYESAKDEDDMLIGTPLHYACTYKAKQAVIEFLIQTDPTMLQRRNQFDRTPLHQACLFKASAKTVSYLVKQYPKAAETPDKDGYTPLHLACENGASTEVVRTLVSANPEACVVQAKNRSTPLHLACSQNASRSVVRILIDAQPEAAELEDRNRNIPLHLAAESIAPVAIVEMLIKAFPDGVYAESDRGQTPLRIARRKKAPFAVLRLLEE